ncbi:GumC domain-containing protein [Psychroflexus montanilacus]|uniref:hypothetical protein n=1 Tax=Psychroflexus montanilacus TaxID=2873598 RepID=UPI001CCA383D|nr:hypothetical protein [Psychroflexus montanilacus]MBZ9652267.1 hypothetical protein [Psychroflexus montanilacus]
MQDHPTQSSSDEIDLGVVFEKIKLFFKSILIGIVQVFQFFWKHKFVLLGLLVIGFVLQYYIKSISEPTYTNQFLIQTNYKSTEYLYDKVNSINAKIESKDTADLKVIFGNAYARVKEVEVEPVIDVYSLVNESTETKETFELLLDEFGDFSFVEDKININEYPTHKLKIHIKGKQDNESIAKKLYASFAENPFYEKKKNLTLENLQEQLLENKTIRSQIDSIIKEQKGTLDFSTADNNSINFSGSQNLQGLLNLKRLSLETDLELIEKIATEDEVLKIVDTTFGVYDDEKNISYLVIPQILIGLYCLVFLLVYLKKKILNFVN